MMKTTLQVITLVTALTLTATLTGCNVLEQTVALAGQPDPVVVLSPGYKVKLDGIITPVFGYDACPTQDPAMSRLFGPAPNETSKECIVLDDKRETLHVRYPSSTGIKMEAWTIVRSTIEKYGMTMPITMLQRPNGTFVLPADPT